MLSILLAEGENLIREALRALLEEHEDLQVAWQAATSEDVLYLLDHHQPDILILDLTLQGAQGMALLERVAARPNGPRILVLSHFDLPQCSKEAFAAGAHAFVSKSCGPEQLVQAIRALGEGKTGLYAGELSADGPPALAQEGEALSFDGLTPREQEVFRLVAQSLTASQIARRLRISPRTVEIHRGRALQKLGIDNRLDIFRYALWRGFIAASSSPATSQGGQGCT